MNERSVRSMLYVDGSVVRKMEAAPTPVRRPKTNPQRRPERESEFRLKKQADKALAFDFKYSVFVIASVFVMVAACVSMLYMESKISSQQTNISNLEAELETIEGDNLAYKNSLENMYTMDQIYDVATQELGMVYAKKGQVVYYNSTNEDYVKQYQNVPEAN